jgi:Protein of unknown function (DUF2726)/Topoisomerase DNA binding C4 zinc finger
MSSLIVIAIVLVVLGLVVTILKNLNISSPSPSNQPDLELTFESCGELFSPAERSFFGVLQQALGNSYAVFGKVRLGDVVQPVKGLGKGLSQTARNKVNLKHIDFVICRADDLSLIATVELDDGSHQRKDRSERDAFVDQALKSAGIPLVRFAAKKGYELAEVKAKLAECPALNLLARNQVNPENLATTSAAGEVTQEAQEFIPPVSMGETPICPACQAEMVKRQARKGPNTGNWFWACSTFPKCRKVMAIK